MKRTSIRTLTALIRSIVVAWALIAASAPVSGNVIGSFVDNGDGTITYSYQVDNSAGLFDIAAWSLEFGFATPDWDQLDTLAGGDVAVPNADWVADAGIPVSGQSAQDFLSLVPAGDVLLGTVLGGFSFTSRFQPGPITDYEFSAVGDSAAGTALGPVIANAVPEGGAGVGGIVLAALAALAAHRPRQTSVAQGHA